MPASWENAIQPACCPSGGLWESGVIPAFREHPGGVTQACELVT